jgi:hypothetical protein
MNWKTPTIHQPYLDQAFKAINGADAESITATLMKEMMDQGSTLLKHFKSSVKHFESSDKLANKKAQFYARLDVAKAIGNQDELNKLMEEAKFWSQDE